MFTVSSHPRALGRTLRPRTRRALFEALESRRFLSTTCADVLGPAGDSAPGQTADHTRSFAAAPLLSTEVSLWDDSAVPTLDADPDNVPIELGVKFQSDVAGDITGIRFYKSSTNTGTHIGNLWSADGTLLATATFATETDSGWQTATFDTPVTIQPNTTYVASYHTDTGHYADDAGFFTASGVDSAPLHALADGADGGNGVYVYGDTAFPSQTFQASNYWVDVTFAPASATPTTPAAPTDLAATAASSTEIDLAWTDNATDETGYRVERSTDNVTFTEVTTLAADATTYADTGLTPDTHYYYQVIATSDAGDSDPSNTADATTAPQQTTSSLSIWDDTAVPTIDADADNVPIEVGVKFQSEVDGQVTGIRFYKGATNTGTHVGNLWSADGTLLATATFSDETDSGWQTVTFDTPVSIQANTTYIASYHTDTGHYANDAGYFTSGGVDNGPLHALAAGVDGGNGVYVYGDTAFPTETFQATNYWVDISFSPSSTPPADTTPAAPTDLSATTASSSEIDLAWTDNATDETGYRVERSTDNITFTEVTTLDPDATSYSDTGLTPDTHYYYRVFAVNAAGDSDPSNTADATTDPTSTDPTTPAAPTDLAATAASSTEIDLAWTDNATDETGYRVERSTDNITFTEVTTLAADATTYADTGLTAGTHYFYKVIATNDAGDSDSSNTADATTDPAAATTPAAPTGLAASPASSSEIDLTWTDNATDETGYRVERSTDNVTFTPITTLAAGATTYADTGLTASTHYYYHVFALNGAGDSDPSNPADATTLDDTPPPPPGTPTKLTGTAIGTAGSWSDSGNTSDKALDGDTNTFFDAAGPDANFVGLALPAPAVITSARVYPRWSFSWRMTGGKIQGSNDNTTWTDLATITTQPAEGAYTTLPISNTTPFKYVRYLSPTSGFGNVAEVEFYTGDTQTPPPPPPTGTPTKLTGTAIGTTGSWNDSGNTSDKALDGDTNTFFDAPTAAGNFVGLSLGSSTVLTSVRVFPRSGFSWRLTGAKIQASSDESSWVDLATITTQPAEGTFTTLAITDPTAYKYVRLLSPSEGFGNVAEVEFYGLSQTPPPPPPTNPFQLTGTPIGTAGSWNNSGNTSDKALDGDTNTFFDAPTAAGNFVGLSLAAPAVLSSARLYPRGGFSWRVTDAKIQGSNDNTLWTDLATVTTQPAEGTFSTLAITDPTAYKYVRYLSPSEGFGNIAEVEFYGTPT